MMYVDYYLKAKNEAELIAAIPEGFEGAIDIIGITYRDDTPIGEPAIARNGFLANMRLADGVEVPASLQALLIPEPSKPTRVWA